MQLDFITISRICSDIKPLIIIIKSLHQYFISRHGQLITLLNEAGNRFLLMIK